MRTEDMVTDYYAPGKTDLDELAEDSADELKAPKEPVAIVRRRRRGGGYRGALRAGRRRLVR
ncbi:hypothetical protein [Rhodococcus sp. ACS1]|uniref:hypothetical protein n=1 Tax=Rhodococcus sp. ACS1 TaxID=2028570 RepID=UPI0015CB7A25